MVRGNVFSFFLETLALKVYVYPRGINFKNIKPIKDGQFQNMAVTSLRWRWCLLLVLLCMLPSSSVNLSSICCFQDNDTRLERLGSNSTVLIVDSFFCPAFLEFLEQFSASATDHVIDDMRVFNRLFKDNPNNDDEVKEAYRYAFKDFTTWNRTINYYRCTTYNNSLEFLESKENADKESF